MGEAREMMETGRTGRRWAPPTGSRSKAMVLMWEMRNESTDTIEHALSPLKESYSRANLMLFQMPDAQCARALGLALWDFQADLRLWTGVILGLCLGKKPHEISRLLHFHKRVSWRTQIIPALVTTDPHTWSLIPWRNTETRPAGPCKGGTETPCPVLEAGLRLPFL